MGLQGLLGTIICKSDPGSEQFKHPSERWSGMKQPLKSRGTQQFGEEIHDLQMEITEMVPRARMQIPHSARFGKGETPAQAPARAGEVKGGVIVGCCKLLNKYY